MSTGNVKLFPALIPPKKKNLGEKKKKLTWLILINENPLEEAGEFAWEKSEENGLDIRKKLLLE